MSAEKEIDRLADFIIKYFPDEIGRETSESAVDVAIRLLTELEKSKEVK